MNTTDNPRRFDYELLCSMCTGRGRVLNRASAGDVHYRDLRLMDCVHCNGRGIPPIPISEFEVMI
jgi:hypothetical protein